MLFNYYLESERNILKLITWNLFSAKCGYLPRVYHLLTVSMVLTIADILLLFLTIS